MKKNPVMSLINGLMRAWFPKFRQSFSDIRWRRLRYMLIFAHAPLFSNIQEVYFRHDPKIAGVDAVTWMRLAFCVGAGLLFAFASIKNINRYSKFLAGSCALFFTLWLFIQSGILAVLIACLFTFFYGGTAAVAIFHYAYALNDTERFFGAALTSLYYVIFQLILATEIMTVFVSRLYIVGLVLVTTVCIFSYRVEDYIDTVEEPRQRENKQIGLMLYFFFSYHIVEMFYTYIQGVSTTTTLLLNGLVGIAVFSLATYLYFYAKFNLWHMCNLFFGGFLIAYILRLITDSEPVLYVSRAFRGFEQIGFIAAYTLLGSILRKNVSFRSFKRILIVTLNVFSLTYILLGIMIPRLPIKLSMVATCVAFFFFIGFLFLSPIYADFLYSDKRKADDTVMITADASAPSTEEDLSATAPSSAIDHANALMTECNLTRREREIITLLMQGYLYKQCASELGISINTVNFHARNAYRKLNVSGRSELFSVFMADK
ncbi:MAG TPA: LuxR family transcriptional regulator [Clostridiaceae bacterium]|nr:LuxR family transcriptional regulator [Clostridiaceae bacterium]